MRPRRLLSVGRLRRDGDGVAVGRRLDGLARVEAGDAIPGRVRGRVPLLMARQEIEAHKLLVAVAHVASVDFLGVVWWSQTISNQPSSHSNHIDPIRLTVQLMALQVLGSRINLLAASMIAHEPPRRAFATRALVARTRIGTVAVTVDVNRTSAGSRAGASRRKDIRGL